MLRKVVCAIQSLFFCSGRAEHRARGAGQGCVSPDMTLGQKASVIIDDRYVYEPDKDVGETILQTSNGAFLFASGRIKGLK